MRLIISSLLVLLFFVSCSSRDLRPDYKVLNASTQDIPEWIDSPQKADENDDNHESHAYFSGDGHSTDKRLCKRSAEVRARHRIAEEISTFIDSTYNEAAEGGVNSDVSKYIQETIEQKTQSYVVGSRVLKTYWERRIKMEENGEGEMVTTGKKYYHCYAAVRIKNSELSTAIDKSAKLLYSKLAGEVKNNAEKLVKEKKESFIESK